MTGQPPHRSPLPAPGQPPVEWYIGREGKQYGPVTDVEFRKLIELGHLKPTDLVWREGFAEWRPAKILTDAAPQPRPSPPPPVAARPQPHAPAHAPSHAPAPERTNHQATNGQPPHGREPAAQVPRGPDRSLTHDGRKVVRPVHERGNGQTAAAAPAGEPAADDVAENRVGRRIKVVAAVVFFALALGAAAWALLPYKDTLVRSVAVAIPSATRSQPPVIAGEFRTLAGFTAVRAENDTLLQGSQLFQLLKRTHPDWYGQRLDEIGKAVEGGAGDAKAAEGLVQALAQLRRQHAGDVLSAPAAHLTAIASTFVTNLGLLRGVSVDACYKFISNGETAPGIASLFQSKDLSAPLQRQLLAVFAAVEQGRSTPRVYPMPRQADYTALLAELESRGWTQADMQLFSDSRALAKAAPQDVCRLVTEWFESQLALKDNDVQLRLIADSLKPLIAG